MKIKRYFYQIPSWVFGYKENRAFRAKLQITANCQLLTSNYYLPTTNFLSTTPAFVSTCAIYVPGGEVADVNGNCTLTNKIFQNSRRLIRGTAKYCFVHFLHFATFFPKTTSFQTKNVTFIILIFSELNIIDT